MKRIQAPAGSIILPTNFDFETLPVITLEDCHLKDSFKLANYFSDLKNLSSDAKESRRSSCAKLRELAMAFTLYFRAYVKEHQKTGISRKDYAKANPIRLPNGTLRFLKTSAFGWRIREFLKAHGAKSEQNLILPESCIPILRLANDRLVNPGADFKMNEGQTIMVLAALRHFPNCGYRNIHEAVKLIMEKPSFEFRGKWDCPSEKQVRSLMSDVPPALKLYLTHGFKELYARFGLAISREFNDLNHLWAGDAFFLKHTPFFDPRDRKGKLIIPCFSYLLDCSTRHLVSYKLHQEAPNGLHGLELLRNGLLKKVGSEHLWPIYGRCDGILSDNRAPLGSSVFVKAANQLEIKIFRIRPRHSAENGTAERFGRTAKYRIMAHIRVALKEEFPRLNRKNPISITQWERFSEIVHAAIVDYHHRYHRTLKCTPYEAVQKALDKTQVKELDKDTVIRMTSFSGTSPVQKQGIYVYKHWFMTPDLKELEGEVVEWIYDPFEREPKLLILKNGEVFCTAFIADPGTGTELRALIKNGSAKNLQSRVAAIGKEILGVESKVHKQPTKASYEARVTRTFKPELEVPEALSDLPDMFSRLTGGNST